MFKITEESRALSVNIKNITDEQWDSLLMVIRKHQNIMSFSCRISNLPEYVRELVVNLMINTSIKYIFFEDNIFSEFDVKLLSKYFGESKTLQRICLSSCSITDHSIKHLVDALLANPQVTYLDLSYNEISDDGLYPLIEHL